MIKILACCSCFLYLHLFNALPVNADDICDLYITRDIETRDGIKMRGESVFSKIFSGDQNAIDLFWSTIYDRYGYDLTVCKNGMPKIRKEIEDAILKDIDNCANSSNHGKDADKWGTPAVSLNSWGTPSTKGIEKNIFEIIESDRARIDECRSR